MIGLAEPALRFLHYAVLLGLFGWTAFSLIGVRGLDPATRNRGAAMLVLAAIAAPLLSLALMLASIAAMMGTPVTALDGPMIEAMVLGTDMGWAFLLRFLVLVAGLCAVLVRQRVNAALPIAVVGFAGALMTLGWSGHAAATEGALGLFQRLINGVHLLAAGLWIGAIAWFLYLTVIAYRQPERVPAQPLLLVMHRFAPLGVGLVTLVSVTGLLNSQLIFGLENSASALATTYGILLAAKVALVGGMLAWGAHNARIARRHALADDAHAKPRVALSALRRSLAWEFLLATAVLALVAVLGMMSPTML